ncbi:MAG: hypothetical protein ABIJ16_06020 [Bacteroidota bacterium]
MKSSVLFILAFLFAVVPDQNDPDKRNDLKKMELRGKVKSLKEISYEVMEKSDVIVKGKRIYPSVEYDSYYCFNQAGYVVESKIYNITDNTIYTNQYKYNADNQRMVRIKTGSDEGKSAKWTYSYNARGKLLSQNYYSPQDKLICKETYTYDDQEVLLRMDKKFMNGLGHSYYTYITNSLGYVKEKSQYDNNNKLEYKYLYSYDSKGNLLAESSFMEGKEFVSKTEYKYNEAALLLSKTDYYGDGSVMSSIIYGYDQEGNLVSQIYKESGGVTYEKWKFKNKTDENGNWVQRIQYKNDNPNHFIERIFEYYE